MQWSYTLWIGIGGFLGANARYLLSIIVNQSVPAILGRPIPTGTAFVNILGSFLLAFFLAYVASRTDVPEGVKLLVGTGFFGAFTTFSTYANESVDLINQGQLWTALGYIIVKNALCLIGVVLGLYLANKLF